MQKFSNCKISSRPVKRHKNFTADKICKLIWFHLAFAVALFHLTLTFLFARSNRSTISFGWQLYSNPRSHLGAVADQADSARELLSAAPILIFRDSPAPCDIAVTDPGSLSAHSESIVCLYIQAPGRGDNFGKCAPNMPSLLLR